MSVYSVPKQGYRYDFRVKGVRYVMNGFKTKREARESEARKREEIKNPISPERTHTTSITFLQLVEARLQNDELLHSSKHFNVIKSSAMRWVKFFGPDTLCCLITESDIKAYLNQAKYLEKRCRFNKDLPFSKSKYNKELIHLRSTFNYGIREGLVKENPAKLVKKLPHSERKRLVPTREQLEMMISHADTDEQRDYLIVMADTFARPGEVNCLKWCDVNFDEKKVILTTCKTKDGSPRGDLIPMTSRLYGVLKKRFESKQDDIPYVFYSIKGKYRGKCVKRYTFLKTLCKKLSIPYDGFHVIRHSNATTLASDPTVPPSAIQAVLRHQSIKTTQTYLQGLTGVDVLAIDAIERHTKRALDSLSHQINDNNVLKTYENATK